jgi:glycosyltransferase involved in cell wall biosynthesis
MKILMSAYACEPGKSSEPAVGWNWALQGAKHHDVWVVTRSNNRELIEAALAENPVANLHFVYHDLPRRLRAWKRGNRGIHFYYLLWQLSALKLARRLHGDVGFDAGHHVTFVSHRFPSFLAWLGIPYIWGPVAGAETAPRAFYKSFGRKASLKQRLRDISNTVVRIDPFVGKTARRASKVLAATPDTAAFVSRAFGREAQTCLAIGWEGEVAPPRTDDGPLKAIYVGRLIYWKGVHLALEAMAAADAPRRGMTLTIAGKGPEHERLQQMAIGLGLEGVVHFAGQVPESEVNALLREHNAFLFPSFQDSGAFAVLEAMTQRLPVVAVKSGGPAVLVSEDSGIAIEPQTPAQTVAELCDVLVRLHEDPQLRTRLGDAAARRAVDAFSWERLDGVIDELYAGLTASATADRTPAFAGRQPRSEAR